MLANISCDPYGHSYELTTSNPSSLVCLRVGPRFSPMARSEQGSWRGSIELPCVLRREGKVREEPSEVAGFSGLDGDWITC